MPHKIYEFPGRSHRHGRGGRGVQLVNVPQLQGAPMGRSHYDDEARSLSQIIDAAGLTRLPVALGSCTLLLEAAP
jgi:hypothetical protein